MIINPRLNTLSDSLIERYRSIEPATVGHMLEFGFCDPEIQPLWRPCKIVGPAFTVRTTALDSAVVHVAIDMAEPGDVILIDRNGDAKHACWGGMTSLAAKMRGLAGTIIDGCATDFLEIQELAYPVYSRSITALTTKALAEDGEINTQVQIGGVSVNPGDLVVADSDGILIMPPHLASELLEQAEARQKRGAWVQQELKKGVKISELSGSAEKVRARLG